MRFKLTLKCRASTSRTSSEILGLVPAATNAATIGATTALIVNGATLNWFDYSRK